VGRQHRRRRPGRPDYRGSATTTRWRRLSGAESHRTDEEEHDPGDGRNGPAAEADIPAADAHPDRTPAGTDRSTAGPSAYVLQQRVTQVRKRTSSDGGLTWTAFGDVASCSPVTGQVDCVTLARGSAADTPKLHLCRRRHHGDRREGTDSEVTTYTTRVECSYRDPGWANTTSSCTVVNRTTATTTGTVYRADAKACQLQLGNDLYRCRFLHRGGIDLLVTLHRDSRPQMSARLERLGHRHRQLHQLGNRGMPSRPRPLDRLGRLRQL
jgi:hypothetical protein